MLPKEKVTDGRMTIALSLLGLAELESLLDDASHVGGIPVVTGALPPRFILEAAVDALREGKPPIWFSPFAFIESDPTQVTGTGGFRGYPASGRIEIGYGVAEICRGRGIATAAVRELCALGLRAPDVAEVYAESAADNLTSRRVLVKARFHQIGGRESDNDGRVDQWVFAR
jgi:RimJ/RimL family protein N-acetyltransferase